MSEENRDGKKKFNRRDVVTTSAAGAAAMVAATSTAMAQTFRAQKAATPASNMGAMRLNMGAKAILPDGTLADRAAILTKLGLDPNTPADAWLTIVCGSNASALTKQQWQSLQPQLQKRGIVADKVPQ